MCSCGCCQSVNLLITLVIYQLPASMLDCLPWISADGLKRPCWHYCKSFMLIDNDVAA